ncbi:hypothetical protein GE061_019341 [Apolygus lucorum]|uniref:Uncharacterized protein n=1 Tax=Apolygus lucorum TaxID=248454 RepID=A0A8S9X9J8_APOLU|nr:hypothetical protein GE061_019341 [Apolygus lucorum]
MNMLSTMSENHEDTFKRKLPSRYENPHLLMFSRTTMEYTKIASLLKFSLMVFCVGSVLVVFHADVRSEYYKSFLVQASVSGTLLPSIFRVTSMSMKMSRWSDVTVLIIITLHLIMAGISLYLIIREKTSESMLPQVSLLSAVGFILLSLLICVAEVLGLLLAGTQALRVRSSTDLSEDSQRAEAPSDPKADRNPRKSVPIASEHPKWVYQH